MVERSRGGYLCEVLRDALDAVFCERGGEQLGCDGQDVAADSGFLTGLRRILLRAEDARNCEEKLPEHSRLILHFEGRMTNRRSV